MTVRSRILLMVAVVLLLGAGLALGYRYAGVEEREVLTYDEVLDMRGLSATYHSINNWATVEDTEFTGVPLYRVLEEKGVTDGGAQIRVIAPDGYFWPKVGTVLTLDELKTPNEHGLYPLLAWEVNGEPLLPEPDGTGPLRLVMPQYSEEEVNKPSWVSNVRLIEVGPLPEGFAEPDASEVSLEEVRLYGNVQDRYPVPLWAGILPGAVGLLLLLEALYHGVMKRGEGEGAAGNGAGKAALLLLLAACLAAACLAPPVRQRCAAAPGDRSVVLGMAELKSMPVSGGHYTFLKSQEPFTYYEADYEGVSLSYLLQEALRLSPGADGVVVRCTDGYKATLSLSQALQVYPGGRRSIIAYSKGGSPLAGDEGALRLIVPQVSPGNKEAGGDANTPLCARKVYAVEVTPVPAGVAVPAPGSVPAGSLAVYGAVTVPEPAAGPPATPAESAQAVTADTAPEEAVEAAVEAALATGGSLFAAAMGGPGRLPGFVARVVAAGAFPALLDLMAGGTP